MVLSYNQPAFIPWGGFFARLLISDVMVILDDTLLAQGFTFVNRNRLKGPQGEVRITVPVKRSKGKRQKIKDLLIFQKNYWAKKWLLTLYHNYSQSIYFPELHAKISEIIKPDNNCFFDMIFAILELLKSELNIDTPFAIQSLTGIRGKKEKLLLNMTRQFRADELILPYSAQNIINWPLLEKEGIKVKFLKFLSPGYPQFWGKFIKNLSVLDLLFCLGADSQKLISQGFTITTSDEADNRPLE
jgi:hypothetical protein